MAYFKIRKNRDSLNQKNTEIKKKIRKFFEVNDIPFLFQAQF